MERAEKYSCISRPPSRNDGEGLPEAVASITLLITENTHIEVSDEDDSLMRASTVAAVEINMPSFGTSFSMLLGLT